MPHNSESMKNTLEDLRKSQFQSIYKDVTTQIIQTEQWTHEEKHAMQLLSEGHAPKDIRKQIDLSEESNKKMADLYFMILLNSLIRCQNKGITHAPFALPKQEITSWTNDYPRDQFAKDLDSHKKTLSHTALGREALGSASDYKTLYESTKAQKSEQSSSFDPIENSLDFLGGIADGLSPMSTTAYNRSSISGLATDSYSEGLAVGLFADGVCKVGGLFASLMK